MSCPNLTQPNLSASLLHEPVPASKPILEGLGPLQHILGTWPNKPLFGLENREVEGSSASTFSYCFMPLPEERTESVYGYILKNFYYFEEISFSPISGVVANRGGSYTQVANTLFYEQRVFFGDSRAGEPRPRTVNGLVHAENGSWLRLTKQKQNLGPYGGADCKAKIPNNKVPPQDNTRNITKQMSVPHGNSVLAQGTFSEMPNGGIPAIKTLNGLPEGVNTKPYTMNGDIGNPSPAYTHNPNQILVDALDAQRELGHEPLAYIHLSVDSMNTDVGVLNIPFGTTKAKIARYRADYWLEAFSFDGGNPVYNQLQYSQFMNLIIPVNGKMINFPHITVNTLTRNST